MKNVFHGLVVTGIVARRDGLPYLRLLMNDQSVQVDMAQARNIAMDILQMCARTEADAMIHRFFNRQQYPEGAATALMLEFRDFRKELDDAKAETYQVDPDTGEHV
jgi:hypothetical protein